MYREKAKGIDWFSRYVGFLYSPAIRNMRIDACQVQTEEEKEGYEATISPVMTIRWTRVSGRQREHMGKSYVSIKQDKKN